MSIVGARSHRRLRGPFCNRARVVSVVRHISQFGSFREMREHMVISLWFGIVGLSLSQLRRILCLYRKGLHPHRFAPGSRDKECSN